MWAKHTMFDFSLHTPLIIRTPGMTRPGVPTAGLVEALDLYPTLADLCGLKAPAGLDGVSLRPMLDDPSHPGLNGALSYYGIAGGVASLRTARYRLTYFHKQAGKPHAIELFDHQADPYEQHNIADEHPDIVKQLLAQLQADHPDWVK
jgi:arylsulfatase A-like enzyme